MQLHKEIGRAGELTTEVQFVILNHYTGRFSTATTPVFAVKALADIGKKLAKAGDGRMPMQWSDSYIEVMDLRFDMVYHLSEFLEQYDREHQAVSEELYRAAQHS